MKNIFKNIMNTKKEKATQKLPMSPKMKTGFRRYSTFVLVMSLCSCLVLPASATGGDPLTVVNNLSDFIFSMIRAVGLILLGWGIVQVGLSLQSHDPSQRSNGFLTLAGGIIITFAKEILTLITG
ncbi:MAG: glutamyl-tRNA amidotransferase [Faecousia sp.]